MATTIVPTTSRPMVSLGDIPDTELALRYGVTRPEIEAVRKALAPVGTTDFEMLLYLGVCKRLGLDAFVPGLVHFIRFKARGDQGERTGIVLGVYGYLEIAQQQKDCDGLAVKCFPESPDAAPTHATCTIWKKSWAHPLEITVSFKEKKRNSPFWAESPRQALETAAIRRACKLAWPSLFAPLEDEGDEDLPAEVRGAVGTVLGEHHDAPVAEAHVVSEPPKADEPVPVAKPATTSVDEVAREIREIMDDPAVRDDVNLNHRCHDLINVRLDARKLDSVWTARPEDLDFLCALRDDLRRMASGT